MIDAPSTETYVSSCIEIPGHNASQPPPVLYRLTVLEMKIDSRVTVAHEEDG